MLKSVAANHVRLQQITVQCPVLRRWIVLLVLFLVSSPLLAASYGDFDVAAPARWVDLAALDPAPGAPPAEDVRFGIHDLLSDHQVRVTPGGTTHYYRIARRVLSSSGVQNSSELSLDFDPSYERLVLHEVRVTRNGVRVPALNPESIRIIEQEGASSDRIYDGRLRALVFLDDIRPGDVIDYSWSTVGANPLLNGKFVDELDFSPSVPTARVRHRILIPASRTVRFRSFPDTRIEPVVTTAAGETTLVWEARNVAPIEIEDGTPSWYQPWRTVQVSEFESWEEVSLWAQSLFATTPSTRAAMAPLLTRIRRDHATPDAQALAAVRFVQDEIRYLGIEMGRNSHEPRQPEETLTQRWGDCKDKTLLLVTLLRELGFQAWPAMVNTRLRHRIDGRLPSPFEFDHVITHAEIGARPIWIDATVANQGGGLLDLDTPGDERALLVRAGAKALSPVVVPSRGLLTIDERYDVDDAGGVATLAVRSRYSGSEADAMRAAVATMSPRDLARERINAVAANHPRVVATSAPRVEDDREHNVLTLHEQYRVRDLFTSGRWIYRPRELDPHLSNPTTLVRSMPLAVTYPLDVQHNVAIRFSRIPDVSPSSEVIETPALRFQRSSDLNGSTMTLRYRITARRDFVTAGEIPAHIAKLDEIRRAASFDVRRPGGVAAASSLTLSQGVKSSRWVWGLTAAVTLMAICFMLAFSYRRQPAIAAVSAAHGFRPGEAPSSAIRIRDADEVPARSISLPCRCGAGSPSGGDLQRARYEDDEMLILTRQCAACGVEQSVYFTVLPGEGQAARPA